MSKYNKERPEKKGGIERWLIGLERNPRLAAYYRKFIIQYGGSEEHAMTLTRSEKVAIFTDAACIEYNRLSGYSDSHARKEFYKSIGYDPEEHAFLPQDPYYKEKKK